ncbi:MAG TPA: hypothetical protein VKD69_11740 [Vicinamibacterales bacterium]|nr:hypothetical protein [Vicinamibacterales bacterium]
MAKADKQLVISLDQAIRLTNAWRRLCAFTVLVTGAERSRDIAALVHDFAMPAGTDIAELVADLPIAQRRDAHDHPLAWHPDFSEERWRQPEPDEDAPRLLAIRPARDRRNLTTRPPGIWTPDERDRYIATLREARHDVATITIRTATKAEPSKPLDAGD